MGYTSKKVILINNKYTMHSYNKQQVKITTNVHLSSLLLTIELLSILFTLYTEKHLYFIFVIMSYNGDDTNMMTHIRHGDNKVRLCQ